MTETYDRTMEIPPLGPFMDYLGLRFSRLDPDRVEAEWTAGEHLHQIYGIVHGGVHASIVESVGSMGAVMWYGDRGRCVGVSNTTEFFRAATEGTLTTVGTPVHQDDHQQVWSVVTRDVEGRLISSGQLRVQNLPHD